MEQQQQQRMAVADAAEAAEAAVLVAAAAVGGWVASAIYSKQFYLHSGQHGKTVQLRGKTANLINIQVPLWSNNSDSECKRKNKTVRTKNSTKPWEKGKPSAGGWG